MKITKNLQIKILEKLNKFRIVPENDAKGDLCYGWKGAIRHGKYPLIYIEGKSIGVHRATWMACEGRIPVTNYVRHICGSRVCTNPKHLFVSTCKGTRKSQEERKNSRIGKERLSVDLPSEIVFKIKKIALKYNQTVTKYILKRLIEIINYENKLD